MIKIFVIYLLTFFYTRHYPLPTQSPIFLYFYELYYHIVTIKYNKKIIYPFTFFHYLFLKNVRKKIAIFFKYNIVFVIIMVSVSKKNTIFISLKEN